MTLFFSSREKNIQAAISHGFAKLDDTIFCCDRIPVWPDEFASGVGTLKLEVSDDVQRYEVWPMDLPDGRWFDIPSEVLDRALHENHPQADA